MLKRKLWSKAEDDVLTRLILEDESNPQWESISSQLSKFDFTKTAKQCKDRWVNNLSPALNKSKWSCAESRELLQQYLQLGNRWKVISATFAGRTDNSVKNQFFSVIRKSLRTMNKFLGINCNTNVINSIRPKVVAELLSGEQCNAVRSALVQRFSFTPFAVLTRDTSEKERLAVSECVEYVIAQNATYISQKVKGKRIGKLSKSMTTNRTVSAGSVVLNVELASASSMVLEELHTDKPAVELEIEAEKSDSKSEAEVSELHQSSKQDSIMQVEETDVIKQKLEQLLSMHTALQSSCNGTDAGPLRSAVLEFFSRLTETSDFIRSKVGMASHDTCGEQLVSYVGAASKLMDLFKPETAVHHVEESPESNLDKSLDHNILGSIHARGANERLLCETVTHKPTYAPTPRDNQASVCFYDAQSAGQDRQHEEHLFCEQLEEIFDNLSYQDFSFN